MNDKEEKMNYRDYKYFCCGVGSVVVVASKGDDNKSQKDHIKTFDEDEVRRFARNVIKRIKDEGRER